jgi:putative glutathione S-transferase
VRDGRFHRESARFRKQISAESHRGNFPAAPDRYHLYASYACPWSHRTLIFRKLKGLEKLISISITHWHMGKNGWTFAAGEGVLPDPELAANYVHEIYRAADSDFTGRATVPILWDKVRRTIVNNESADIIRIFNSAFDGLGARAGDYYPNKLREEIDDINDHIYKNVNNGVYKAGFATSQQAYEEAVEPLFDTLGKLDRRLASQRYLVGDRITEADWRLFVTLVRFDPVYFGHFKCNRKRLVDYQNLWPYVRDLYQVPGISESVRLDHIKPHYYMSHKRINPTGVVPVGPELDFEQEHTRAQLAAQTQSLQSAANNR